MKTNQSSPCNGPLHALKSFIIVPVLLLLTVSVFYACNKKGEDGAAQANELQTVRTTDRLLTVANVVPRENGSRIEVWFYETPLIHSFKKSMANADKYEALLQEAKDKKVPVNMRLAAGSNDQIAVILAATGEQVRKYQEEQAVLQQQEQAEQVAAPDDPNARPNLTAVIPNVATLNTIWNAVRNLCCQLPGPYAGGQCVPYQYVADGCYARAHKMRQVIEGTYGYTSYKVFNWADQCPANPGVLAVQATLWGNNCCVNWWYHVAPYVYVQSGSTQVAYLLDPSMHSAPVAITTWLNAQKNVGCGYAPTHKQAYYTSNAYAPNGYNYTTCAITVGADNNYNAANATCNAYSGLQGCF